MLYLLHLVAPDRLQFKLSNSTTYPMPNDSCTTKCYSLHWVELLHVSPYFDLDSLAPLPISCYTASISRSIDPHHAVFSIELWTAPFFDYSLSNTNPAPAVRSSLRLQSRQQHFKVQPAKFSPLLRKALLIAPNQSPIRAITQQRMPCLAVC